MRLPLDRVRYRICGLRVASTIRLPELSRDADAERDQLSDVDFEVRQTQRLGNAGQVVMTRVLPDGRPWLTCFATNGGYRLQFRGLADFTVARSGARVSCAARPGTPLETIRSLFLDQVMPLLLNVSGREVLHASAVCVPQGVCAFVGEPGSGKSTLAAAFHVAGYPVLSDDCLLVRNEFERVVVESSYPGLRLWADSAEFLLKDAQVSCPVSHYSSKLRVPVSERAPSTHGPFPLRAVYVLEPPGQRRINTPPRIGSHTLRDAVMGLIGSAFRLDLTDRAMILRQMQTLERVARLVPVKQLRLCDDLGALAKVRDMILEDLRPE